MIMPPRESELRGHRAPCSFVRIITLTLLGAAGSAVTGGVAWAQPSPSP